MKPKKIAIVYDWIDKWGGVERLLLTLHETFPHAIFYTSFYDRDTAPWARDLSIHQSFLRIFPSFIKKSRILSLPFFVYAFESFDFTDFDLVISVTSSFAKSIVTKPNTNHVSIMLTPTRYFWNETNSYISGIKKVLSAQVLKSMRNWDYLSARRPDKIYSISEAVKEKVKKYYRLESDILYPPFDMEYWANISIDDSISSRHNPRFYLVVSRLEPYKKVDLVVNTFNKLPDKKLIIIGKGTCESSLKKIAGKNIFFYNTLSDAELAGIYKKADALIMPQEEEFGYVALESQFFECPVIAYNCGGAKETIIDQKTGLLFDRQTQSNLTDAIEKYEKLSYTLKNYLKKNKRNHLNKFSKELFIKSINNLI